ncbi:acyl-CoA dehydrogenase [Sphingomonas sp. So64.6b]|uniref:acyl-CoA dehydrogenase family protein n=1 Tax=Sphingomonas sp. So64.6b TaxID=2997354 RepID=UPI001602B638|nr:acyl-CoA dehydrogenase family protein [Sphingomonas sp. So64.6b]QNA84201.1 acyl-CoA dehydrogenase [Sphingomonas sp. So64.6b]
MSYGRQTEALVRQLEIAPFLDVLEAEAPGSVDPETWAAIVAQAARFAEGVIDPLDTALDRQGASLCDGRVVTADGHAAAWRRFADDGWLTLALPEAAGGQGLPLVLLTACEELFNRASPAFTMLPTPNRTAAALLENAADPATRAAWVPRLASGEWTATICISEPDAGSDVGRIRTRATCERDGIWRVTGEKCWISFGDHDLAARIGHCMLARSSDAIGVRGLSLFLVPNTRDDGAANGVHVRRIEEKLGLHGSPTCVMGFEQAEATLVGEAGRGLQTLFHMMLLMRLSCAPQGVGVAEAALATATGYGRDRRQGGDPAAPPVAIVAHADVQRQLLRMAGRVEVGRGIALAAAVVMDLGERCADAGTRAGWLALAQFLLPIAKDYSARLGFDVASESLQVLGGAGYTREWPVERRLRDARVFGVFEGTTGIQAIDLLHRRLWRERGDGLNRFLALARADISVDADGMTLGPVLDRLENVAGVLAGWQDKARDAEAGATAFLDLCGLAVGGWVATRLARFAGDDAVGRRIKAAARFFLAELEARAEVEARLATLGGARLDAIGDYLD